MLRAYTFVVLAGLLAGPTIAQSSSAAHPVPGVTAGVSYSVTALPRQTGRVQGHVTDASTGEVLAGVNVILTGTPLGAATDRDGHYTIENVPAGSYAIEARFLGYQTMRRSIRVSQDDVLTADFSLTAANAQLAKVVIEGQAISAYDAPSSAYVAKMPLARLENPQAYQTITSDLLKDQAVVSFDEAVTNAPGVFKLWESTGRGGDGAGYYSLRAFSVQPQMMNALPALRNGTLDPANIERIEIIKGPSGALFGSSLISYGGLINVVTKRPQDDLGGEIAYRRGGFGLDRVTADVNTPFGPPGRYATRLVAAYHDEASFQDAGSRQSFFVAPSVAFDVSDRLGFLAQAEYYHSEQTNPTMLFLNRSATLRAADLEALGYDPERSYTSDDLTISTPTAQAQVQMNVILADGWTSQTAVAASRADTKGYYTYLWDLANEAGTFGRYLSHQRATSRGFNVQQNILGHFSTGSVRHELLLGLDYLALTDEDNSSGWVGFGSISLRQPSSESLSRAAADTALAGTKANDARTEQRTYSAYLSDMVEVLPHLSLMASLRLDHFDSPGSISTDEDDFSQTAFSPKLGLVYQPLPDRLALFANYMNGFLNVAPRVQADGSVATLEPEQANQWEVGLKTDLYAGRLAATVSYYDITVSNKVRNDPERANFYVQDGEDFSRGLEASVVASPLAGLRLVAGASHNMSEVVATGDAALAGRRPESAGPSTLVNAWASYRVSEGPLAGLGLGFGGNYASKNRILNRATTGIFALPAYAIFNASAFYEVDTFRLDLKVSNVTDEAYYNGWSTINPQPPRRVSASVAYLF